MAPAVPTLTALVAGGRGEGAGTTPGSEPTTGPTRILVVSVPLLRVSLSPQAPRALVEPSRQIPSLKLCEV